MNGAFWAAAGTTEQALLQKAIQTGSLSPPVAPERADPAKVEAIVQRLKKAQDPVAGAEILYGSGAITRAQLEQVKSKAAARPVIEPLPMINGGVKMSNGAQLTQYAKDILAKTGANVDNGGGVNLAGMLPAGAAGILGALGLGGTTIAALGGIYGLSQMIGVQYPWETGAGEGFIAPWSRDIVQDEAGRWVTRQTRPDLFGLAPAGGTMLPAVGGMMGFAGGASVVGAWDNAAKDGSTPATAQYIRLSNGVRVVRSIKTGVVTRYRHPRVIGVHKNMNLGQYVKAERVLDRFTRRIARRTKSLTLKK